MKVQKQTLIYFSVSVFDGAVISPREKNTTLARQKQKHGSHENCFKIGIFILCLLEIEYVHRKGVNVKYEYQQLVAHSHIDNT